MFEVNDIPPIDSWALQELIAENVQHEEFLFFRFYAGDEQDYFCLLYTSPSPRD